MKRIPADGLTAVQLREAAATEFSDVLNLVVNALALKLNKSRWDVSPDSVYPDRIVVRGDAGRLLAYPYTIDDSNQVQIADPVEVVKTVVPAAAAQMLEALDRAGVSGVFIEAAGDGSNGIWLIRVIRAGLSLNNVFYPDAVLREAVRLFEGARVFQKSDAQHIKGEGKDIGGLIGGLRGVKFVEGKAPDTGEIQAELVLIEPAGAVATKLREAFDRDLASLFGFSIDADGKAENKMREGKKVRVAKSISKVNSVDLIVEPGAGGELIRLVEAVQHNPSEEDTMRIRMIEAIKAKNPSFDAANASDDQIEAAYREAIKPAAQPDNAALEQVRLVEARMTARELIAASTLPAAAKDKLTGEFREAAKPFTAADVEARIKSERDYLAKFTESGKPVIHFEDTPVVEDRSEKMQDMLDAFFDPAHKNHRAVRSFKECYIEFTGDRFLTGQVRDCDQAKLREANGGRFVEAVVSSSWAAALGDSITRRMQALYASETDLQVWRKVAVIGNAKDFRTQERFRVGGYGNLPAVAQNGAYAALTSPSDAKATYAVSKRGGLETVTLEAITNDDVGAIRRIPTELALAAANTLYEFVFDFYRTNPVIYDTLQLYHATHANLFAAALSAAEFAAHRLAMVKQTRAGSLKRVGISPAVVLVPFELQETAYNLFVRNQNLDKTFVQNVNPEVICPAYWTDGNDWCTVADPNRAPVVEVSFLNGQEEPDLFVQDLPNVGSLFSNDAITYKIRHIYGGNVLVDGEKFTTKAVVP